MSDQAWPTPSDVNRVIQKINTDEAFKSLLLRDANTALTGLGIAVPAGLTVRVHENTASTMNYILPSASKGGELSDTSLEAVTGGALNVWEPKK